MKALKISIILCAIQISCLAQSADEFFNTGKEEYYQFQYTASRTYFEKALQGYFPMRNKEKILKCFFYIGMGYYEQEDVKNALDYTIQALEYGEEQFEENDPGMASLNILFGKLYHYNQHYDSAILFYDDAIRLLNDEKQSDALILGEAYANKGYANDFGQHYESAVNDYIKSIEILTPSLGSNSPYIDWILGSIAYPASKASLYTLEVEYTLKSLESKRKVWGTNNEDEALALKAVAIAYEHLEDYRNASDYFEKAFDIFEQIYAEGSVEIADQYDSYSIILSGLNDTEQAVTFANRAYQIRKRLLGKNHPDSYDVFQNIGNIYYDAALYKKALLQYTDAEKTVKNLNDPQAESRLYYNIAQCHEMLSDFESMNHYLEKTLQIQKNTRDVRQVHTLIAQARYEESQSRYEAAFNRLNEAETNRSLMDPENRDLEAFILNNQGVLYRKTSQYTKARQFLQRALDIRRDIFGEYSSNYEQTLSNFGILLNSLGEYQAASDTLVKALKIAETLNGSEHLSIADNLLNLSVSVGNLGLISDEIEMLEKALSLKQKHLGTSHHSMISILHNLGLAYGEMGSFDKALKSISDAREIIMEIFGDQSLPMSTNLNNQQKILSDQGKKYNSLELQLKALRIIKSIYGDQSTVELAMAYNNLGAGYMELEDHEQASLYLDLALDIYESLFGKNHPETFDTRYNKAQLKYKKSRYDESIQLIEENLGYIERHNPDDVNNKMTNLRLLASCFQTMQQPQKALQTNQKALDLIKTNASESIEILANLGDLWNNQGSIALALDSLSYAISSYQKALNIYEQLYAPPSYQLSLIHNNLADCYRQNGQLDLAISELEKSEQMNLINGQVQGHLITYFLTQVKRVDILFELYESNQDLKYLLTAEPLLKRAEELLIETEKQIISESDKIEYSVWKSLLSFIGIKNAYYQYLSDPNLSTLNKAFQFAERSKSNILLQSLEKSKVKKIAGVDDSLIKRKNELEKTIIDVRDELFKNQFKEKDNRSYIQSLNQRMISLNEELRLVNLQILEQQKNRLNTKKDITIQALQSTLKEGELIVEYAASDQKLFAFLITKQEAEMVMMPYEDSFSKLITAHRNAIFYRQDAAFNVVSKRIGNLIWKPINDKIQNLNTPITEITVIPEGPLNYLPFESIRFDERFLIENYAINYAYSAGLKILNSTYKTDDSQRSLLAFAPVFADESIAKMTEGAKDVFAASRHFSDETTRGFTVRGDYISPLPATKTEVENINQLALNAGQKSEYFVMKEASESQFKQQLQNNYRYLHFATHGFVNEAIPEYSGVFLSQEDKSEEDCILFASEIYSMDIQSDLVTLSACETGLGKFSQGEGIVGLARAFMYAGSKNLLVSQWQVDDSSTSELMVNFYTKIFKGESKSSSLRQAKLSLLGHPEYRQPYFWAPFILIGQ
jgi:CHAT domain-containing protein